jgi:hypothetical protein
VKKLLWVAQTQEKDFGLEMENLGNGQVAKLDHKVQALNNNLVDK